MNIVNIVAFNMCCLCVLSEIFAGPAETWPCNLNDINTESEAAGVGKRWGRVPLNHNCGCIQVMDWWRQSEYARRRRYNASYFGIVPAMTTTQTAHIKLSFSSPAGSFAPLVTKLRGVDQWDDTKSVCNVQGVSPVTSTPVPQMTRQHLVRCFTAVSCWTVQKLS